MFKLDNGELMKVKSGELSRSFVPSVFQLQAIIAMGNPEEIAIILSSSYEMDVLRQLNGSIAYLQANEQVAREVLFNGKEPKTEVIPTDNVEILKLRETVADKDKTIGELTDALNEAKAELSNSPINEYANKLKLAEEKVAKSEQLISEVNSKLDEASKKNIDLLKEIDSLKLAKDESDAKLKDANDKLVALVNDPEKAELTAKLKAANETIEKLSSQEQSGPTTEEYNEQVNKVEVLTKENAQLKEDGAKVVENYKKAKDALVSVMQKFGISYENGEYVMVAKSNE